MHHTISIPHQIGKITTTSSDLRSNHSPRNPHHVIPTTPHKRPINIMSPDYVANTRARIPPPHPCPIPSSSYSCWPFSFRLPCSAVTVSTVRHLLRLVLRRLRLRVRALVLLSFPTTLYLLIFLLAADNRSLLLNFLSAVAFSSTVLLLFALSIRILPPFSSSLRLFLSRSSSFVLPRYGGVGRRRTTPPPVLWSIGDDKSKSSGKRNWPATGLWVQVYSNGDVYEGEFHRGKSSGSGVYYYYMSGRYEGFWIDEKYDGYGVETWARGSRYRGQYRKGLRHGFGIYKFYTGDVYAGEWSNGQSHGSGVHTCEDGSRYVGEFKWGVKHGLGHYHFRNGDTYAGEYFGDKMHGFGVYQFANGHRYEGAWHEGRKQGLGMYTFRNGETQAGDWQNGVLVTLSTQTIQSGSPVAVYHSRVLNAVQEARRAAEKAYNIPRVDERVNKAVALANKAANAARVASVKATQKQAYDNRR